MNVDRRPIFEAVRQLRRGEGFSLAEVAILDAAIDRAFAAEPVVPTFDFAAFFTSMRGSKVLGATLSQDEVSGCEAIITACRAAGFGLAWTAYVLATAYHETAGTMRPIREYGRGKGRPYGRPGADGQVAYGRGYVQLTWAANYANVDQKLGLHGRLVADFDLALDPTIAASILVRGMAEGWFTQKKLGDYLGTVGPASRQLFEQARRIVNGTDKAAMIAGHALEFQAGLKAAGMGATQEPGRP